jgi:hypothetical protein
MRGAIHLHRPAGQQQAHDNIQNQQFLFRQAFHGDNLAGKRAGCNNAIICNLRLTIYAANSG